MNRVIVLRRPLGQQSLQRELEDLFQRQWGRPQPHVVRRANTAWQPQVDMYEVEDAIIVLVELAGMRDSEIELTLSDTVLLIAGQRPELHGGGPTRFHQLAINEGPFRTAVLLPWPVAEEEIEAQYDDGLLRVRLPKRSLTPRRIAVATTRQMGEKENLDE